MFHVLSIFKFWQLKTPKYKFFFFFAILENNSLEDKQWIKLITKKKRGHLRLGSNIGKRGLTIVLFFLKELVIACLQNNKQ
jgi:hypothetical protein